MITVDDKYMARCLTLAQHGRGSTGSNPMVGAVVVHNNRIIGEGYHRAYGEPHAEVNAICSVKEEALLCEATLYVSLEPCSHYGKTPPCTALILKKRIPRVVIACLDPFPEVSGRGVRLLREAGVEVVVGILEHEAYTLNLPFMTAHTCQRPYIVLKWAQSADGYLDRMRMDASLPAAALSSAQTLRGVHKLRSEVSAIMVGTRTALLDNPSLTVRHWVGNSPIRVVLDRQLRIPTHYHLLDGSVQTLLFTEREAENSPQVEYIRIDFNQPVLPQVLAELYRRGIHSLMVEGGAYLLNSFIHLNLWDQIRVETAPQLLHNGVKAPDVTWLQALSSQQVTTTFSNPIATSPSSRYVVEYTQCNAKIG